jgi:heme/copper-type cytochrome/quinol oxidase subunit 2
MNTLIIFNYSFFDYALPKQLGFQPSASPIMEGIIDLHHFAMFYVVYILAFVFFIIYLILETFTVRVISRSEVENFKKIKALYNIKFLHHTLLEIL